MDVRKQNEQPFLAAPQPLLSEDPHLQSWGVTKLVVQVRSRLAVQDIFLLSLFLGVSSGEEAGAVLPVMYECLLCASPFLGLFEQFSFFF